MDQLLKGSYSESIDAFDARLDAESTAILRGEYRSAIICNKALALLEMGLYRKCIKCCETAIELTPHYIRAHILHGQALKGLGKDSETVNAAWFKGIVSATEATDAVLIRELQQMFDSNSNAANASASSTAITLADSSISSSSSSRKKGGGSPSPPPLPLPESHATPVMPPAIPSASSSSAAGTAHNRSPPPQQPPLSGSTLAKASTSSSAGGMGNAGLPPAKPVSRQSIIMTHAHLLPQLAPLAAKSNISTASFLAQARAALSHATGDTVIDDMIALGYLQVNTGNTPMAVEIFEMIRGYRTDVVPVYIGLGSAYALRREFDKAIGAFSRCIELDPKVADAWKRRGQVKSAMGGLHLATSVPDFTESIRLAPREPDTYMQRAMSYQQLKNYKAAMPDLRKVLELDHATYSTHAPLWNLFGMSQAQLGEVDDCIHSYSQAVKFDPKFREAYINHAHVLKEAGKHTEAEKAFQRAIDTIASMSSSSDSAAGGVAGLVSSPIRNYYNIYQYRAALYYGLGDLMKALKDYQQCEKYVSAAISSGADASGRPPTAEEMSSLLPDRDNLPVKMAVCYQALGFFPQAMTCYNKALAVSGDNTCWNQKQVAHYVWKLLDIPVFAFNLDNEVAASVKDGWVKHLPYTSHIRSLNSDAGVMITEHRKHQQQLQLLAMSLQQQSGGKGKDKDKDKESADLSIPAVSGAEIQKYVSALLVNDEPSEGLGLHAAVGANNAVATVKSGKNVKNNHLPCTNLPPNVAISSPTIPSLSAPGNEYLKHPGAIGLSAALLANMASEPPAPVPTNEALQDLIRTTHPFGVWIQLKSQGFLPNMRQHRMAGLAAFEMARLFKAFVIEQYLDTDGHGVKAMELPNCSSSGEFPHNLPLTALNPLPIINPAPTGRASGGNSSQTKGKKQSDSKRQPSSPSPPLSDGSSSGSTALSSAIAKMPSYMHRAQWRDFMDIIVRWRQISEPNDSVWWLDRLSAQAYAEGFGLQTPLVNGQLKTIRYFCYYTKAISVVHGILESTGKYYNANGDQVSLSADQLKQLRALGVKLQKRIDNGEDSSLARAGGKPGAFSVEELTTLYQGIIKESFFIITPYYSIIPPNYTKLGASSSATAGDNGGAELSTYTGRGSGRSLPPQSNSKFASMGNPIAEGTRLTIVEAIPDGHVFNIRTPSIPARYAIFDRELEYCISSMGEEIAAVWSADADVVAAEAGLGGEDSEGAAQLSSDVGDDEEDAVAPTNPRLAAALETYNTRVKAVVRRAFQFFYVWVNFAPLSRGSAATGYVALISFLLAIDHKFAQDLPENKQLDWEAILNPSWSNFVDLVTPWCPVERIAHPHSKSYTHTVSASTAAANSASTLLASAISSSAAASSSASSSSAGPQSSQFVSSHIPHLFADDVPVDAVCGTFRSMIRILSLNCPAAVKGGSSSGGAALSATGTNAAANVLSKIEGGSSGRGGQSPAPSNEPPASPSEEAAAKLKTITYSDTTSASGSGSGGRSRRSQPTASGGDDDV